jgi:DNA-directed RNA polymerase subunit omega
MATEIEIETTETEIEEQPQVIDSKYRMILIAAKRSKQLQRGARSRVGIDTTKHKATKVAIEELKEQKVPFRLIEEE